METNIIMRGKIIFEPEDITTKHGKQSSWKKIAMVFIYGDICQYYSWFLMKRYNIILNPPVRGGHISFINDSVVDLTQNGKLSKEEVEVMWLNVKNKWHGKEIDITLDLDPRSNGEHWWLNIPNEDRDGLQAIRNELGLGRPYFGMHMSLGYIHPKYVEHSKYILNGLVKGLIK